MPERSARFITLRGRVQGVGFRPFVYRIALAHRITGWVRNVNGAVEIHAEGTSHDLHAFADALLRNAPPLSAPGPLAIAPCAPEGGAGFAIRDSEIADEADIHLPADGFVCADCLAELHDPANRRHRYPFINCTQCGPRYTLITALPYDRPNTAMRDFALCADCRTEYENPLDRRFHAEPIACPVCGPHLAFSPSPLREEGEASAQGDHPRTDPPLSPTPLPGGARGTAGDVLSPQAMHAAATALRSATHTAPSPFEGEGWGEGEAPAPGDHVRTDPPLSPTPLPGGARGTAGDVLSPQAMHAAATALRSATHTAPSPFEGEGWGEGEAPAPGDHVRIDPPLSPTPLPEGARGYGDDETALAAAVAALRAGKIVAVKGVGGYHLMCDARNDGAIATLRARKPRPAKPLAIMFEDLAALRREVATTSSTEHLLVSPERPIVLLPRRPDGTLPAHIAPGLGEIGCLLPYSPLHALLLADFGAPLVATSGNLSGEPVLTTSAEAQTRLAHLADAFLHHDRPIVRPADDPVYRPIAGTPRPLRLGRGSAPLELDLPEALSEPVLALGSHMKNTVCLAWENRAVLSPHIGELDSARSLDTLAQVADDLQQLYQVRATRLLLDRHPGYGYRRYARDSGLPIFEAWHHAAHASALAWEFPHEKGWIVFTWDGTGLGADGNIWGGEALVGTPGRWTRAASMRTFRLPGGDRAGREPWRAAAALLWETNAPAPFAPEALHTAWQRGLNAPGSSAIGRLFDAAAALTGVCSHASFEGEGPMRLETLADTTAEAIPLPLERDAAGVWRSDWAPLVPRLTDTARPLAERAACFHHSLAQALVDQAIRLREETGITHVGLTGGVFQNRVLAEATRARLDTAGFTVRLPARIPVNDAGLSFGQVIEFLHHPANP